jgi:lysophospholipase L1-like esterase
LPAALDFPDDLPATVAVVGDSLTLSAQQEITAYLTGIGIEVLEVDGAVNRRMTGGSDPDPGIDVIEHLADNAEPELWVIALGTNDVGSSVSPDQFGADVEALLDAIPDDAPLVWVDLWIRDRPEQTATANAVLRSILGRRSQTAVADWFSHGEDAGLVAGDGVHLTDDGRYMFAATIAAATVDLFA